MLSRTQLFEGVWGYDFGATSNSLGVHIGYLRRKLETAASHACCTRSAVSATSCASHSEPAPPHHARRRGGRRGRRRAGLHRRLRRRSRRTARPGRRSVAPAGAARSSEFRATVGNSEARPPTARTLGATRSAGGRSAGLRPGAARRTERRARTSRRPARTAFPSTPSTGRSPPGGGRPRLRDETAGDVRLRVLTVSLGDGNGAVQLARPLNSIDALLGRLRLILLAVCLGGVGACRDPRPRGHTPRHRAAAHGHGRGRPHRRDARPGTPHHGHAPTTKSANSPSASTGCSTG